MNEAIITAKTAVKEIKPWQWATLAGTWIIGFAIGVGIMFGIKHNLAAQGICKSVF